MSNSICNNFICCCRGLEILQEIELSESRKNAFSDVAIGRILDNHLAAKYALRGYLSKSRVRMRLMFACVTQVLLDKRNATYLVLYVKLLLYPPGSHNFISDGFFDVGQLQPGSKLLQLEDYCKAEVDQKRAILLINARPE